MSLGENSLVAAYQGKGQLKSRPSGTRVVTFIGDRDGGIREPTRDRRDTRDTRSNKKETDGIRRIRDPTRKRLTGYGGYEIQRETVCQVSTFKLLVLKPYPTTHKLIQ